MVERRARDRRRAVVAVREVAVVDALAAVDDPARLANRLDLRRRVLVARDRRRVDDGPHPVLAPRRVADTDLRGRAMQPGDEVGEHRVLDVHARARRALLPRQPERGAHHAGGGVVQVRVPRHDRGVLAAHLGDARPRPAPCANVRVRCMPTSKLPVNVTPATSGCRISASPVDPPGPVTKLNTRAARPRRGTRPPAGARSRASSTPP